MRHNFSTFSSYNVLQIDIDEKQVIGTQSADGPVLVFHFRIDLASPFRGEGRGLELEELRCRLAVESGYLTSPISVRCNIRVHDEYPDARDVLVHLTVPLDMRRMALLDGARREGRLAMRLSMEAFLTELSEVARTSGQYPKPVWGKVDVHRATCEAPVVLDQSHWLTMVLPHTGYGRVLLVELPRVPIEQTESLKTAYAALMRAQKLHGEGFTNEAVGQCRVALEPFFEAADNQKPNGPKRLKISWESRLGAATYAWLNECLAAVKRETNKPHHMVGDHFASADALMLITITTALISYAARVGPAEPDPAGKA